EINHLFQPALVVQRCLVSVLPNHLTAVMLPHLQIKLVV
ncbi:hypothetical protein GJ496_000289, partial [Pomphorhynchus laevis]